MKRLLSICFLLWCSAIVHGAPNPAVASQDDLGAFKELQQVKFDSQKELQTKDVEAVRQQIAAVDKRVDDQLAQLGQSLDRFGIAIAVLGLVITVLLVLGGFLGYRNAKSEAREVAVEAAQVGSKAWFDDNAKTLKDEIEGLAKKAAQVRMEMEGHAQGVQARAADLEKAIGTAQESIEKAGVQAPADLAASSKVLAERARELKDSNEDSYSFDDWNTRAHAAYTASALEDAAYFWHKAAGVANADVIYVARALVNRAIAQGELNQNEAAIATYDEVLRRFGQAAEPGLREAVARALVNKGAKLNQLNQKVAATSIYDEVLRRFGEATEPGLRVQVAKALINKGITQSQLNENDAAIATYDKLLHRFGEAAEPGLREPVARALVNKGAEQGQLNQYEAALATCEEVLRRFGGAAEPWLRVQVAKALVNKGVIQSKLSQHDDSLATYSEVVDRYGEAAEPGLREAVAIAMNGAGFGRLVQAKLRGSLDDPRAIELLKAALDNLDKAVGGRMQTDGMVFGNRAYVQCLLGNSVEAESDFAAALRAPVNGGRQAYETALKDLAIHPLPEDARMRALVERAWSAFQAQAEG